MPVHIPSSHHRAVVKRAATFFWHFIWMLSHLHKLRHVEGGGVLTGLNAWQDYSLAPPRQRAISSATGTPADPDGGHLEARQPS
ncbi:hypothetical protein E2C01_032512 [Portunus trituberculatus]|uniref:Uncharacterized protein n=1 Tax=Portunus trituberculatus TaxID=210409 RepID=A0A5B7F1K9_PORTR|nr:hypothetical protein [Portunus trituberculatus]